MTSVLYTGSFNPPTLGHVDIIQRASVLFTHVTIGIATNTQKKEQGFTLEERKYLLEKLVLNLKNVRVEIISGLSFTYARQNGITSFLRSLRNSEDLNYEQTLAIANRQLSGLETIFILAQPEYGHISSSLIKELAFLGHRLDQFIPSEIEEEVFQKFSKSG